MIAVNQRIVDTVRADDHDQLDGPCLLRPARQGARGMRGSKVAEIARAVGALVKIATRALTSFERSGCSRATESGSVRSTR